MTRLLLLGLDGGDLDFIKSRATKLPYLQKLISSQQIIELDTPKALSGSVWPTFYSGANPGVHGIYQHLVWDAQRMGIRRISPDWKYYHPFWQDLENSGQDVVVLDVPYSFPTALKKGVEITDWGTHGQTYPIGCNHNQQKVAQTILDNIGKSPIGRETPIQKTPQELQKIESQLISGADLKGKLIIELMEKLDWNLFVAIFGETHRGGHVFYSDLDGEQSVSDTPFLRIYQAVDRALQNIADRLGEDVIPIIFSVHGMTRDYAQGHIVRPLMEKINEVFLEKYCGIKPNPAAEASSLIPFLRRVVPARLQYPVGAIMPDSIRQWVVEKEIIGGLDWSKTPGFALRTDIRTELRLNLIGRESQGILERGSKLCQDYVNFLTEVFLDLRDLDTDSKLVDEILDTPQLFPGDYSDTLPDLVITWHPRQSVKSFYSPLIGEITAKPPEARGGDHTDYGFAMVPQGIDASSLKDIKDFAHFSKTLFKEKASIS